MRGGAQAHLLEADDGHFYVVKFRNNPQHRRILINEWICSAFLKYLGIAAPETTVVNLAEEFLAANPEVHIQLGNSRSAVPAGWHFGSRYPGDPATTAVYDFVPDVLLQQVENLADFAGMLVLDKWMSNADARQSIFVRGRVRDYAPSLKAHPRQLGFLALMMDHGFQFDGPHWRFSDSPVQGMYFRPMVYSGIRGWDDLQPWLERVRSFPEQVLDDALKGIPPQWLEDDEESLGELMEKLLYRRGRVPQLIEDCRRGRNDPFPAWK